MSLFEQASLVVTPNAYKAGKLYSIKPTDGSGDLDVVRATSRTRVKEQGLVEIPRTNLVLRSEEFDNGSWGKTNATVTANSTTSPNGTLTADTVANNAGVTGVMFQQVTVPNNSDTYNASIFVKKESGFLVFIIRYLNGTTPVGCAIHFNKLTGVFSNISASFGFSGTPINIKVDNYGDYFRFSYALANNSSGNVLLRQEIQPHRGTSLGNLSQVDGNAILWGAQIELGNTATEYIPTTSSIRTRFAGITQNGASASNIPALDYTNASCPSILVEPQRTNLLLRSEEFDNAYWIKTRGSIIANATIAPDGSPNADKFTETTFINNSSGIERQINVTNGLSYSSSAFFKKGNVKYASVSYFIVGGNQGRIIVDLDTKELTFSSNVLSYKIEQFDNDYIRISITIIANATASCFFAYLHTKISNNINYNGDGTGFTYLWGAQLEAGSNATSYIPTVASAVTRNADVISKTGISSLIGQTEGVLYFEGSSSDNGAALIYVNRNLQNSLWLVRNETTNTINGRIYHNSNVIQFTTSNAVNSVFKVALAYKSGDSTMYVNGIQIGTNTNILSFSAALTTLENSLTSAFIVGNQQVNINKVSVFPTRLSNAQLAQLTTI